MNTKSEIFVVYVVFLNLVPGIHPDRAAQIAFLPIEKVKIPDKYSDFTNVFLEEKALILLKRTELNEYAIIPDDGK